MNLAKLTIGMFTVATLTTACSKPNLNGSSDLSSAQSISAEACTSAAAVDTSGLKIEAPVVAQVGQPVMYQLNKNLNCSATQNVNWQNPTSFAQSSQPSASALKATYSQPGNYIVSVTVNTMSDGSVSVAQGKSKIRATASAHVMSSVQIAQRTTVVGSVPLINAPEVAVLGNEVDFSLAIPSGYTANNIVWNLDDGATAVAGNSGVNHTYFTPGTYALSVAFTDASGTAIRLSQPLNIVQYYDGLQCLTDAGISAPSEAYVNNPVSISSYTPSCIAPYVQTITWTLGDGSSDSGASITHTYTNTGSDTITSNMSLNLPDGSSQTLVLTQPIAIVAAPAPTPTPVPVATPTPSPTATPTATPAATPTPSPTPVNPNSCSNIGQTKDVMGAPYTQQASCGLDGHKTQTFELDTKSACQMSDGSLQWTQISQTPVLQSEGPCQGQSCSLPDGGKLTDGQSQIGVVIGQVSVPVTCQFGEQGITSSYNQIEDKTCNNGALSVGNVRNGSLITAGACPTYSWTATGTYGACSADCGGTQNMTYACQDNGGNAAPADHCTVAQPVVSQVCDGNPSAVAHTDVTTADEDANSSSQSCPTNQIGVVVNERTDTTTTVYACVNHAVQATATVSYSPWVAEPYCRPFTAYRCSQDSLNEAQGLGRYKWMVACQDQDPIIKDFLTNFADVSYQKVYNDQGGPNGRNLYPTFSQVVNGVEKAWIAPTVATASCTMPASAYISAVCLSGCATPEQQLVTQAKSNAKMKYTSFLDAYTNNHPNVGTLPTNASIDTTKIKSTPVDQWVTDMMDSDHAIRIFHTHSGLSLSVTTNHTLIVPDGSIVIASSLKVGDSLTKVGGEADEIVSIEDTNYFGKVYNVFVKSSSLQRNIVVTNGFLNGTDFYQNEGVSNLNRVILRNALVGGSVK